jgi:hypothetical protein
MRGQADMLAVLEDAKANLQEIGRQRQEAYRTQMANVSKDTTVLDLKNIEDTVNNALSRTQFKGQVKDQAAFDRLQNVKTIVDEWKALDPAQFHTPEGLDALKQRIGAELETIPFEATNSRAVVGSVYNSVKQAIEKQAPTYAKTMKAYSDASDLIREIERSLSLGKKSAADTALRKLQSVMRNNANTNYGQRLNLLQELEQQGGRQLSPALAGQAMSTFAPRGIQQATSPLGVLGAYQVGGLPQALGMAAISSPRVVGEAAYLSGRVASLPRLAVRGLLDLESMLPPQYQITPKPVTQNVLQFAKDIRQAMPPLDARTLNLLYQLREREE